MLTYTGTVTLETERLALRRFREDDTDNMFHNWADDPEVTRYMRWSPHKSRDESAKLIGTWLASYDKDSFYLWAITLRESDEPIGSIGLMVANEQDECADFGYCIGKRWWNQGFVTEALKAVLRFGFETVGFNRIEAYHSINNPASGAVMRKAGMTHEGFARQKFKTALGFEDSDMYAILKSDYMDADS